MPGGSPRAAALSQKGRMSSCQWASHTLALGNVSPAKPGRHEKSKTIARKAFQAVRCFMDPPAAIVGQCSGKLQCPPPGGTELIVDIQFAAGQNDAQRGPVVASQTGRQRRQVPGQLLGRGLFDECPQALVEYGRQQAAVELGQARAEMDRGLAHLHLHLAEDNAREQIEVGLELHVGALVAGFPAFDADADGGGGDPGRGFADKKILVLAGNERGQAVVPVAQAGLQSPFAQLDPVQVPGPRVEHGPGGRRRMLRIAGQDRPEAVDAEGGGRRRALLGVTEKPGFLRARTSAFSIP